MFEMANAANLMRIISSRLKGYSLVFLFFVIYATMFSYFSNNFSYNLSRCNDILRNFKDQKQDISANEAYLRSVMIYAKVSEIRAAQLKQNFDSTEVENDILNITKRLVEERIRSNNYIKEHSKTCDDIEDEKRNIDLLALLTTAALTFFGFWAGSRSIREK